MKRFWRVAVALAFCTVTVSAAQARELSFERYAQEARALMALSIAVQELAGCEDDLKFSEEDVDGTEGSIVAAIVTCEKFPGADGKTAKASVKIELGVDDKKVPIGPTNFEYNLP